jgi:predicted DNA-binding transcriptional regulator AlpA
MEALLSVDDVCRALELPRSTWDKWRAKRVGPRVIKLPNGSLRVRPSDLAAWLEGRAA